MTDRPQHFASDNYAGICPQAWAALEQANGGSALAYGEDLWTQKAAESFRAGAGPGAAAGARLTFL